jgi:glyoxylase-like metal-dependent hydrolase (beta-lactamase superfamily II)
LTSRYATLVAAAAAVGLCAASIAQTPVQAQAPGNPIHLLPLRGNVYVLTGAGGNITASVGKDGVLLVNTGAPTESEKVLAAVKDLSRRVTGAAAIARNCVGVVEGCNWWSSSEFLPTTAGPRAPRQIAGIVYTSDDAHNIGGSEMISAAGRTYGVRNIDGSAPGAWIVAHENMTLRTPKPGGPPAVLASESYAGTEKKLNFFNGEAVIVTHPPAAHSDGDSMVYFRGSEVLAVGDLMDMSSYPVIDVEKGGTIQGMINAFNWMLDVAVVEHMMEGGTLFVPGRGRMADSADVAYYRDMLTIFRDRVRALAKKGMTLEQIKAARPTRDYDARWGKNAAWTPAMFVEAIHKTLDRPAVDGAPK